MTHRSSFLCAAVLSVAAAASAADAPAGAAPRPAPAPAPLDWEAPNERSWIVAETARTVIDIARFAARRPLLEGPVRVRAAGASDNLSYTLEYPGPDGRGRQTPLRLDRHIWAPTGYLSLAALELAGLPRPAPGAPQRHEALLTPRSPDLARESRRISEWLATDTLEPAAHEEAALLLGVFALREAGDLHSDTRPALCRMTAHLAVARALRGLPESRAGALADALVLTLVGRQKDALLQIAALESRQPRSTEAELLRAMRVRNTADWRILEEEASTASLLLRLEQYRAIETSLGAAHGLAFLESFRPEPLSEWARVAAQRGVSVEQGQRLVDGALELELADAAATWEVEQGAALAPSALVEALNGPEPRLFSRDARGKLTPHVIDWGLWAGFFRRNLCQEAETAVEFLDDELGMPDAAAARGVELRKSLSGLVVWPTVELRWLLSRRDGDPAEMLRARQAWCPAGVDLVRRFPRQLTIASGLGIESVCDEELKAQGLRSARHWLELPAPPGTALLSVARIGATLARSGRLEDGSQETLRALHELAPFDRRPVGLLPKAPAGREAETLRERFGPLLEYDLWAMTLLARAVPREESPALYERIVALDPDTYLELGGVLVDLGREDEAAAAGEKAIAQARDRVGVSNGLYWLVGYYCDRGNMARARAVAEIAADVYSSEGLRTMGYLMERLGRYTEAESWYKQIVERYESTHALDQFYVRYEQRVADGRFRTRAREALQRLFPDGLRRVALADLQGRPGLAAPDGSEIVVSGRYVRSTRFGLRKGDVVVALNGYAVRNDEQYELVWSLDDAPEATAIVWRDGRYVEVKGPMADTKYGPVQGASSPEP